VGVTPSTWNFWSNWLRWSEIVDFQSIFARSASAVAPSKKSSINTNRMSTTRFLMSLRWTSHVAPKPPKGAQKRKTAVFRIKWHFAWRKSATKFFVWKLSATKLQDIHWLSICVKIIGGGRPLLRENLANTDPPPCKTPIFNLFSLVAPQP